MALTRLNVYDLASKEYYGSVTLPENSGIATHALVFMLKQTICYYFGLIVPNFQ